MPVVHAGLERELGYVTKPFEQNHIRAQWDEADPLMQDFLVQGNIGSAEAFYSLSEDDHKNLLLCQIASEIYNIPRTMCLLSDPQLQDFYEPLGMHVLNGGQDFLGSALELLNQ